MLAVIGIEKMEEVSKLFSVFFFAFFDLKKNKYENTDCIQCARPASG